MSNDTSSSAPNAMAEFLDKQEESPYSYPVNDRNIVEGKSSLQGSWLRAKNAAS